MVKWSTPYVDMYSERDEDDFLAIAWSVEDLLTTIYWEEDMKSLVLSILDYYISCAFWI